MSEAVASIAMRTQTIQLLRDGLFRACEAYMNGAIDQHQYNIILLNIDRLMVTLLGVDAIGGMGMAPAVAIGATSAATANAVGQANAAQGAAKQVQSEAMANIVTSANAHSSMPALCISLLASGELRLDNPGQHAVLSRCDYLLAGTMNNLVNRPQSPPPQYKVSRAFAPAPAVVAPAAITPAPAPAPAAAAPQKKVAGWLTRLDRPSGNWSTEVAPAPIDAAVNAREGRVPPWTAQVSRNTATE